ncbi:unnamed protein product [Heterobilharzia americana]|nr:unnamed protein product [Heterobilharzia americana]
MFAINYEANFLDHRKISICLTYLGPNSDEEAFNTVYCSLQNHYEFTSIRNLGSKNEYLLDSGKRSSLSDTSEVHSDIGFSSSTNRQPIWLRFTKEHNPINNAWSCFQSYRATLGLLAFTWCSNRNEIQSRIKDYVKHKKLLSDTLIGSRLFLLLRPLNNECDSISVEEANVFVAEKLKEDSVLLSEIVCHPADHLFASETNILKDSGVYTATDDCPSIADKSTNLIRPPFINHRIGSTLQELVSSIYWSLKKMITARCSSDIKFKTKESSLSKEQVDTGDDVLMAPEENEAKWNIIDETKRKILGRSNALSALSAFTERTGATSSVSAQADVRTSWMLASCSVPRYGRFIKQKRATGRLKKYLGDIFLQLGDIEMAQVQYNVAIEHLKPIGDNLWVAGALEGLCAVGMCRHTYDQFSNSGSIRSKSLHRRHLDEQLSNGSLRKPQLQESDILERSTSSSLDLASTKSHQPVIISSADCCNYALETMELYNKVALNPYLFEEFKFKVIRLLITKSQKRKACEILDSLIAPSLSKFDPQNSCSVKRYLTIVRLYKAMNFSRKASLALWLLSASNHLDDVSFEHETLLNGLKIQSPYSPNLTQITTSDMKLSGSDNSQNNKDSTYLMNESQPQPSIICRLITNPPLWSPFIVLNQLNWITRITGTTTSLTTISSSSSTVGPLSNLLNKSKSLHQTTRHFNSNINPSLSSLYFSKSSLPFRSVGWCELQLKVMYYLINQYKAKINLEDTSEISWDIGLKLIGYCFSVLDSWPEYTDETGCISCMDDLCRLAVLRCPDQPINAPSMTILNYCSEIGQFRRWPRSHRVVYSNGHCRFNGIKEVQIKPNERQMLDLVEIPVHQLPLVRLVTIPPIPSHFIPHSISKGAAENVVPLSKSRVVVIRTGRTQSKQSDVYALDSPKSTGPFVYNPFQNDNHCSSKNSVVDWVCEEPGYIELVVDNKLPIDLRISGVYVELMPTNGGPTKEASISRLSSVTSDYDSSLGSSTMNGCSETSSSFIHLEAVCLIVKTSQSVKVIQTKHLANPQFEDAKTQVKEGGFSGQLESGCLLEEADFYRQFPNCNAERFWRRSTSDVNCKLPSRTSGIRLSIAVVPTLDMLLSGSSSDQSNTSNQYRVVGITYRLVDCGGMRVCLRPPFKFIYSVSASGESSNRGRERHLSGSSSSTFSTVRSSWTFGSEAIFPNGISGTSEFDNEHLLSNALGIQFSLLPLIRLQPAMPRLCIFPGRVCSAFSLEEASDILKNESNVQHVCDLAKQLHFLGLSKFRVPDPSKWSNRVAAVLDLSIFPYETRWLPVELYIRDENRPNIPMNYKNNGDNSSENYNLSRIYDSIGHYYSIKRHLNLLHFNVKLVSNNLSLLTKLNLTATDFIQCIGIDDIRKKFPLPVENHEVPGSLPKECSDFDDHLLPFYATHVGVIWLRFDSEKYWQTIANRSSTDSELNDLVRNVQVQSIYIELEIEYAVDAVQSTPSSERNETPSNLNPLPARRISLGFKLKLLSSNCCPLNVHDLMLTFEDEPLSSEDNTKRYQLKSKFNPPLFGENVQAQTLLYGSIETNLSHIFLPYVVLKPEHRLQYRLELELKENWGGQSQGSNSPVRLSSAWVRYLLPNRMNSISKRQLSLSVVGVTKSVNGTTVNNLDADSDTLDGLETTHQIRLPLIGISDLVFSSRMMRLVNPKQLKSNELGIPVPVKSEVPGTVLESNIKIFWYSRLHARWISSPKLPESHLISGLSEQYEEISLCSRFHRYGRLVLSSHECQIDPKWFSNESLSIPLSKPWYEYSFLNPGSSAGLLWAHNIWIDISLNPLSEGKSQSNFRTAPIKKPNPQSQLCLQCRQDFSVLRKTSAFTRRISSTSLLSPAEPKLSLTALKSQVNALKADMGSDGRKISMPDLRGSQQSAMYIDKDNLYTSSRICTYPLNPVSISITCGARQNLFQNIRMQIDSQATDSGNPNSDEDNSSDNIHPLDEFQIERAWIGPAVYRHVQHVSDDDSESTQTTLLGPLIEGIDYAFIGQASGSIGISVYSYRHHLKNQTIL